MKDERNGGIFFLNQERKDARMKRIGWKGRMQIFLTNSNDQND